jgi:hypothetical protein
MIINSKTNIAETIDILCKHLAESFIYKDKEKEKKLKYIIQNNINNSHELKNELHLYKSLTENSFKDINVCESFLSEAIKRSKKIDQKKLEEQYNLLYENINKAFGDLRLFFKFQSKNKNVYSIIENVFSHSRKNDNTTTLKESTDYYSNLDNLIECLNKSKISPQEKPEQKKKITKLVYEQAVKIFNKKYNASTLSEYDVEMIQDYLSYRSVDNFKKSLSKRLKNISESLSKYKSESEIKNINELKKKIDEYKKYLDINKTLEEHIGIVIKNVSEFYDVSEKVKEYYNDINK